MSAIVGQDWRPKTLRELWVMYQAKMDYDWTHTSHILSQVYNANAMKGKTRAAKHFHPFHQGMNVTKITPDNLKHVLGHLAEVK